MALRGYNGPYSEDCAFTLTSTDRLNATVFGFALDLTFSVGSAVKRAATSGGVAAGVGLFNFRYLSQRSDHRQTPGLFPRPHPLHPPNTVCFRHGPTPRSIQQQLLFLLAPLAPPRYHVHYSLSRVTVSDHGCLFPCGKPDNSVYLFSIHIGSLSASVRCSRGLL